MLPYTVKIGNLSSKLLSHINQLGTNSQSHAVWHLVQEATQELTHHTEYQEYCSESFTFTGSYFKYHLGRKKTLLQLAYL